MTFSSLIDLNGFPHPRVLDFLFLPVEFPSHSLRSSLKLGYVLRCFRTQTTYFLAAKIPPQPPSPPKSTLVVHPGFPYPPVLRRPGRPRRLTWLHSQGVLQDGLNQTPKIISLFLSHSVKNNQLSDDFPASFPFFLPS